MQYWVFSTEDGVNIIDSKYLIKNKKVKALDADTIDLAIYGFVLVYARNGWFIIMCVLFITNRDTTHAMIK